jgi:acylpyruvate hydrolase
MKIICIGRNYADHAKEMNSPAEPVVFMKPATALLKDNKPFYYPEFSKNIHYEVEVVLKITKNGKHIQPAFAAEYYNEVSLGIDWTARDLQEKCKKDSAPWEISKSFDNSALIGKFLPLSQVEKNGIRFQLRKNDEVVQIGNTIDLIFSFKQIICYASKFFTLQKGDLIYTGTPAGVGAVKIGDKLDGFMEGEHVFSCLVK